MPNLPSDIPGSTLVTVYEAVNEALREIWVGLSMHLIGEIESRLRARKELSHWKPSDRVSVRVVEYSMPMRDARDFVRRYELARANAGWTIISDASLPEVCEDAPRVRARSGGSSISR